VQLLKLLITLRKKREMKQSSKNYALRAVMGGAVIVLASLGSSLASNVAIGDGDGTTEFGQGEFTVKVCDSWIQLNLVSGATGQYGAPAGLSALTGITIQGLDASKCKSTRFTIQAIDELLNPLPIYRTDGQSNLCSDTPCPIGVSAESELNFQVSSSAVVSLESPDQFHTITFDDTLGIYEITFAKPAQLARDITNLTIQSSTL
jgi:hypothetical protein